MIQFFFRILDYFVPRSMQEDWAARTRARVLVGLLLLGIITLLQVIPSLYINPNLREVVRTVFVPVLAWQLILELFCLLMLRKTEAYLPICYAFIISTYVTQLPTIFLTGGAGSAYIPVMIIPAIYAFLLVGARAGLIAAGVATATVLTFKYLGSMGIQIAQPLHENAGEQQLRNWIVLCLVVVGSLIVYDAINRRLLSMLETQRNQFAHRANHDTLTELPNRALFQNHLQQVLARANELDVRSMLLYIDIDSFKPINDQFGHHSGDQVLQQMARRLRQNTRKSDVVARLGGDEFAMILENIPNRATAEMVINKILAALASPIALGTDGCSVSASIGVALIPDDGREVDELCRKADAAMYIAKQRHNTFAFYGETPKDSPAQ